MMTRRSTDASVAVEFGLLLPMVLVFLIGIIEAGRLVWTQSTLDYAVSEAARCGAVDLNRCGSAAQIQGYAASRVAGVTAPAAAFAVATVACGIQVSVSLPYEFVAPALFPYSVTIVAKACYPT